MALEPASLALGELHLPWRMALEVAWPVAKSLVLRMVAFGSSMTRRNITKIGATHGLSNPSSDKEPEQVYVWINNTDESRPIRIEGWVGYNIKQTMSITRKQAHGLQSLLVEALLNESDAALGMARFINEVKHDLINEVKR